MADSLGAVGDLARAAAPVARVLRDVSQSKQGAEVRLRLANARHGIGDERHHELELILKRTGRPSRRPLTPCDDQAVASDPEPGGVVDLAKHGYTSGIKTAISLPDEVFEQAERLARRLRKSRSELYREAVSEYVARHDPEAITETMNRVAEQVDTRRDAFAAEASRKVLERTEW